MYCDRGTDLCFLANSPTDTEISRDCPSFIRSQRRTHSETNVLGGGGVLEERKGRNPPQRGMTSQPPRLSVRAANPRHGTADEYDHTHHNEHEHALCLNLAYTAALYRRSLVVLVDSFKPSTSVVICLTPTFEKREQQHFGFGGWPLHPPPFQRLAGSFQMSVIEHRESCDMSSMLYRHRPPIQSPLDSSHR
ncbi:hypothetical protein K461DRAFT_113200 [Myriangium duriaei CBS 260.36]|uniref:Uncharacterized protein n=1 Tax=Myriangium duriaei CBS 260.36 TaxID=1168546 RepID=A0A9P4J4S8_9PEZI|nr:hypothetical protein K461DRAFT_113200 [Myriangium duriaei CBS 260.36]